MKSRSRRGEGSLIWIGGYKLLQGLLLVAVGMGFLASVNQDLQTVVTDWVNALQVDIHNRYVAALLRKAGLIDGRQLKHLAGLTIGYGAIFVTEGIGLLFKKRWAEYLTMLVTLSFVPLEVSELWKHFTALKLALLVINIAIVVYLIVMLKRQPDSSSDARSRA
jgi:uncharacterized membrane protein (DUF2068 family)